MPHFRIMQHGHPDIVDLCNTDLNILNGPHAQPCHSEL